MSSLTLSKKIFFSIVVFCAFLFSIEIICQYIEQFQTPLNIDTDGGFSSKSRAFLPEKNGTMTLNPAKKSILNYQNFTETKEPNTFRIALLGESSVKNLYPFQKLLIKKLKEKLQTSKEIEILNFGANSYGSTRLTILAKEIVTYNPDLVFVYMGNNEFEELEQLEMISPRRAFIANIIYKSAFARLLSRVLLDYSIRNLKKEKEERFFSDHPNVYPAMYHTFTKKEVKQRMEKFAANLESIVQLFKANKIKVVMSTIPSNYMMPSIRKESLSEFAPFFELYQKHEYEKAFLVSQNVLINSPGRHQSSAVENDIIKVIAVKNNETFFDFEKVIIDKEPHHIPGETLFADHCHLNEKGNLILIGEIAKKIAF